MTKQITLAIHPEYKAHKERWIIWRDLFDGNPVVMRRPEYLLEHELELTADGAGIREIREKRSHYTNWIRPIISIWQSIFFRKSIDIPENVKKLFGDNLSNVDGMNTSLESFIKNCVLVNYLVYGKPIIHLTTPTAKPDTKADEKDMRFRPFMTCINPLQIPDWKFFPKDSTRHGELEFIRYEFDEIKRSDKPGSQGIPRMVTFTKEYIVEGDKIIVNLYQEAEDKETGKTTFVDESDRNEFQDDREWVLIKVTELEGNKVPFEGIFNSPSWIKEIAPQALKYYNIESVLDNIHLFQGHQRVFFLGDMGPDTRQNLAEYTIQHIADKDMRIVTIDPTDTAQIERRLAQIQNNIIRLGLNQPRTLAAESKAVQGADTLRQEQDFTFGIVQAAQEELENEVNCAIEQYAALVGKKNFKSEVSLKTQITSRDMEETIRLYLTFKPEIDRLPTMKKSLVKLAAEEMKLANEEEILKEIEAMETLVVPEPTNGTVDLSGSVLRGLTNGRGRGTSATEPPGTTRNQGQ